MDPSDFYTGIVADAYGALKSGHFDWRIFRDFIRDHGEPALELGCGDGEPMLDLRRRGIDVEGVDSSADMLQRLEATAAVEGLDVVVHHQRMESLDLPRRFRSIFLAGATFTLLIDDHTAGQALVRIRQHLAPGGVALIPLFIPEQTPTERIGLVRESITADGTVLRVSMTDERRDDVARIQVATLRYEVIRQGVSSIVEREWILRWHTQDGFRELAAASGLTTLAVLGPDGLPAATDGDDFDFVLGGHHLIGSRRLALVVVSGSRSRLPFRGPAKQLLSHSEDEAGVGHLDVPAQHQGTEQLVVCGQADAEVAFDAAALGLQSAPVPLLLEVEQLEFCWVQHAPTLTLASDTLAVVVQVCFTNFMVTDSNFSYPDLISGEVHRLPREGDLAIAYNVAGEGRLVVCVPGMGDLRSTFRHAVPALVAAGYRVAWMDLRGHGDSDIGFTRYDDLALAGDIAALISKLGGPAIVVGNSMGAAASVIAAATQPALVDALVLFGPFVRNGGNRALALVMRLVLLRPWGPKVWSTYFSTLSPEAKAADWHDHASEIAHSLRRPGRWRAFALTARSSHDPAEAVVATVTVPTLVVMGAVDPDFKDPAAEAQWIADATGGQVMMVPEAGHYPQSDRADVVTPAVLDFIGALPVTGTPRG